MNKSKVRSGEVLGILTVVREIKTDSSGTHVLCECQCDRKSHVVDNLSSLRRKAKNKSRVPSCGCLTGRPPRSGKEQIPDKRLRKSSVYSMAYEKSRFSKSGKKSKSVRRRVIARVGKESYKRLKKRYKLMIASCYDPKHVRYSKVGGLGIKVCEEWLCPENGLSNYLLHFSKHAPKRKRFFIRRKNKARDFTPENCVCQVKKGSTTQSPPKLPEHIYRKELKTGIKFEVRVGGKYLGRYSDLHLAEERLSSWLKTEGSELALVKDVKQLRKHELYKRWYDMNRRYPDLVAPEWSAELPDLDGFVRFIDDTSGRFAIYSRVKRIDNADGFRMGNLVWY